MANFKRWLEEAKKKGTKESLPPTATSSPLRGANQDQSGFNGKNDVADYTISDETKQLELEGPDSWEQHTPAERRRTVKDLLKLGARHGAEEMPHLKIKQKNVGEGFVPGIPLSTKAPPKVSQGGPMPTSHSQLQNVASARVREREVADDKWDKEKTDQRKKEIKRRQKEAEMRDKKMGAQNADYSK